jgi:capsular polysaccharide export protein
MGQNNILVFIEWRLDLNFFSRFIKGLNECNYELIFLTNSLSLYLIGIKRGLKIFLAKKSYKNNDDLSYLNSTEIRGKFLSQLEAEILYQSVLHSCEELIKRFELKIIFIGNGSSTAQIAMKTIAKHNSIPTLFFENSNIPGKTFIDPMGVNAASSIYGNISSLNEYNVNDKDYNNFIKEYLRQISQTKESGRKISIDNPLIIFDYLGFTLFSLPKTQNFSLSNRISRKFRYRSLRFQFDTTSFQEKFIFFPLQVSSDSQLILNSDVSNVEALEYSYEFSRKRGLKLIVKPHPKEKDAFVIKKILALKKEMKFQLSNSPTIELVRNCDTLITINSTVGLEGLILNKNVIFLGRTFYKDLKPELIPKYICGYLADFPYTSRDDIPTQQISYILGRIKFKTR